MKSSIQFVMSYCQKFLLILSTVTALLLSGNRNTVATAIFYWHVVPHVSFLSINLMINAERICKCCGYIRLYTDTNVCLHINTEGPCKIWGSHGGDYEECRLLGYKNPVRTSQETHYVSATESSRLMLCKIWGYHGDDYEEFRLLGR
jgi:hypothetical protein